MTAGRKPAASAAEAGAGPGVSASASGITETEAAPGSPALPRLKAYRERHHLFNGASWAARCLDCGEVITKYVVTSERRGRKQQRIRRAMKAKAAHHEEWRERRRQRRTR